jgi:hypothetical protein
MRYTAMSFDANGKMVELEQRFVNAESGAEIKAPEVSREFPKVWSFRRVEQLPFYDLVKK